MHSIDILNGLSTQWLDAAQAITFEYLARTQGEAGLPVPQDIPALPAPLRAVLDSLAQRHAPPGALLLARHRQAVCGTVAVRQSDLTADTDALVQRLYVRDAFRRHGVGRQLMAAVHAIAAREGFQRLVLNVMSSRTGALAFYATLGYRPLHGPVDWPYGGIWLARAVDS